jgi:U3 small nucleolar RNA-associated protein 6
MAEKAQLNLEEMLPEIVHFEKREVFSKEELREVMANRRKFEYALISRSATLEDYMSYIDHEISLELRRRSRYQDLGIKKVNSIDHSVIGRIHSLFGRCLIKFSSNVKIHIKYIEFCANTGATSALTKALTKAIQRHPRSATLRILAADRELQLGGLDAARRLLMKAIRMKMDNQLLIWEQFFKLECSAIHRIVTTSSSEDGQEQRKPHCSPVIVVFTSACKDLLSIGKPIVDKFRDYARESIETLEMSILGYSEPEKFEELKEIVRQNR